MSEEITSEEEQIAKNMLWNYFVTQYIVGWKTKFPRSSSIGRSYMKEEHLEFIEWVGKIVGKRKLRETMNV